MSAPAVTVPAGAALPEATRLMTRHLIERRPVVDDALRLSPQIAEVAVHDGVVTPTGQLKQRSDIAVAKV